MTYILILFLFIPLLFYAISAFKIPQKNVRNVDGYFIAYRQVDETSFSNSSIAYAFQLATVYPFLVFAAMGIYLPFILNAFFWGVGIFLFIKSLPRLKEFFGSNITLHGYLGNHYSSSVRTITSILTIIGLWGIIITELFWGSQVLKAVIPVDNLPILYFIMFILAFYVMIYISYGGAPGSFRTDQFQLGVAYFGIFGLLCYLFYASITKSSYQFNFNIATSLSIIFFMA